jgi:hypothetical protein
VIGRPVSKDVAAFGCRHGSGGDSGIIAHMTYHDLLRKLNDTPFQPFRIRLSNSSTIDVREPGQVIVGKSSAVVPIETERDKRGYRFARDWKTISIHHIVEFIDLKEKDSGPKRKRA